MNRPDTFDNPFAYHYQNHSPNLARHPTFSLTGS